MAQAATLHDVAPHLANLPPGVNASASFWMDSLQNFSIVRTIGQGSFGRVFLVRNVISGGFFALKIMKKSRILVQHQLQHVRDERALLGSVRCPFVVKLERTYQDTMNLYFLMEYVPGGELFTLLRQCGRLTRRDATFYASEIVVALEYLHAQGIAYRDLKPENLLIDRWGHVRLVDFGFAKRLNNGVTWTMCGTPEYLAPEVITGTGHGCAVDWWSLGILIFELMAGYSPFSAAEPMKIYERVLQGSFDFPSDFDQETRDLVQNLLMHDKSRRLGCLVGGTRDVMNHPFFQGVDWNQLRRWRPPANVAPFGLQPLGSARPLVNVYDSFDAEMPTHGSGSMLLKENEEDHLFTDSSIRAFSWPARMASTSSETYLHPSLETQATLQSSAGATMTTPSASRNHKKPAPVPNLIFDPLLETNMFELSLSPSPASPMHSDTSESQLRFESEQYPDELELSMDAEPLANMMDSDDDDATRLIQLAPPLHDHVPPWIPHIDFLGDSNHFDYYPDDPELYVPLHNENCRQGCETHRPLPAVAYDPLGHVIPFSSTCSSQAFMAPHSLYSDPRLQSNHQHCITVGGDKSDPFEGF